MLELGNDYVHGKGFYFYMNDSQQQDQGVGEQVWQVKRSEFRRNWCVWTVALYLGWYIAYVATICYISQVWWVGYLVASAVVMLIAWVSKIKVPFWFKSEKPSAKQVASFLELHQPASGHLQTQIQPLTGTEGFEKAILSYRKKQKDHRLKVWSWMLVPALLCFFLISFGPNFWEVTKRDVLKLWGYLTTAQKIVVLNGSLNYTEDGQDIVEFKLSSFRKPAIKLAPDNLVRVVVGGSKSQPSEVEIKASGSSEESASSLLSLRSYWSEEVGAQVADFQVPESGPIYLRGSKPWGAVAEFEVETPPVPKVRISSPDAIRVEDAQKLSQDQVPYLEDTELIPVSIAVDAQHSIDEVFLLIQTSNGKPQKELVQKVLVEKSKLKLDHSLLLEPFLTSDLADVLVVAVAVDKAHPRPHIGKSKPLKFRVESSYGRYRRVLKSLDKAKQTVDAFTAEKYGEGPASQTKKTVETVVGQIAKASKLSARTPFLNYTDRQDVAEMAGQTKIFKKSQTMQSAFALKDMIEQFLWEHELLDDRARDRDFFIAARAFSRAMDAGQKKSSADLPVMKKRLRNFLEERAGRWKKRLEKVEEEKKPENSSEIVKGKFAKDLEGLYKKHSESKTKMAQSKLSKLSAEYKKFLEQLEESEDKSREQKEQKRQQGLANAQNQLRKLQKTQDEISKSLDKASTRSKEDVEDAWSISSLKQKSNIQDTKRLEAGMRAVSGRVGERLKAAIDQMTNTEGKAEGQQFAEAEAHSDLAARLLRNAESIAKQQSKRREEGKRRRRRSGENYYGSSVLGGDVKVRYEYEVDAKYRGKVLDALRGTAESEEDRAVLDTFLRKILR